MIRTFQVASIEELREPISYLEELRADFSIFTFHGDLGSGKTTLISEWCRTLGIADVTSPTFGLVNEYSTGREIIYHFDLYRIRDIRELDSIGFLEYIDRGHTCMIEWPRVAEPYLDETRVDVELQHDLEGGTRRINIKKVGERL